ncbi:MAG: Gfo/Idh/MocA family oxidoreductase, partial [Gemmatimonadetes bacterium]|nr:Gfo/Idh/MocA family oxidoreductase [Gemmatimonadota bacterium]
MVGIGVVGYGYWGPNLVRNFFETPGARVAGLAELDPARRALAERRHPGLTTTADLDVLLADPAVDAVAIATPA